MAAILLPRALEKKVDFSVYYFAGINLRTQPTALYDLSGQPYIAQYIHPAYEAIPFAALSFLGYRTAYIVFLLCNVVLGWAVIRALNLPWELAAFAPLSIAIIFGQDSIVFLAFLTAAWMASRSKREQIVGILLGLSMFRFQNILPIALLLLMWKEWKTLRWFAFSTSVVAAISAMLVSPSRYISTLSALAHNQSDYSQPIERMVNLRGLIHGITPLAESWLLPSLSILVLMLCYWLGRHETLDEKVSIGIIAACLVSYHFYPHDLVILLIPISNVFRRSSLRGSAMGATLMLVSTLAIFNSHIYLAALASLALLAGVASLNRGPYRCTVTAELKLQ